MSAANEESIRQNVIARIPALLDKSRRKAEETLKSREKSEKLLSGIEEKLKKIPVLGNELVYIPVCASLLRSYVTKEYTDIPLSKMGAIVFALLYFVSPADIIPDAVPALGYLDDAAVIGYVFKNVKDDLDKYNKWRENNG